MDVRGAIDKASPREDNRAHARLPLRTGAARAPGGHLESVTRITGLILRSEDSMGYCSSCEASGTARAIRPGSLKSSGFIEN
jgi:hypothetical protein